MLLHQSLGVLPPQKTPHCHRPPLRLKGNSRSKSKPRGGVMPRLSGRTEKIMSSRNLRFSASFHLIQRGPEDATRRETKRRGKWLQKIWSSLAAQR
jgi:hypothetical protein